MNEFKTYHPAVNFFYFFAVISFSCWFMHPVCLFISFFGGVLYFAVLKGKKAAAKRLFFILPVFLSAALINPAFNHGGITVVAYLPSGNPLTLESVIYGICAAFMLVSVICWFSCFNEVITSDKIMYLFGRIIPSLSLVISMTLRFVPQFSHKLSQTAQAQRVLSGDYAKKSIVKRAKFGLLVLSATVTAALENSIETAESMKARGFGLKGRAFFSVFKFTKRDKKTLVFLFLSAVYILWGGFCGAFYFSFFPCFSAADISFGSISFFAVYFMFCVFPSAFELWEVRKWKYLISKI